MVPPATPAWPSSFERSLRCFHSVGSSAEVAAGIDAGFRGRRWILTAPDAVTLQLGLVTFLSVAALVIECVRFGLAHS